MSENENTSADWQDVKSKSNDFTQNNDELPKRRSIWKELESMGEVPPENTEQNRRNYQKNKRRDERNDFPKSSSSRQNNFPRRGGGGRRGDWNDDRRRQSSPETYRSTNEDKTEWSRGRGEDLSGGSSAKDGRISKNSPAYRSMQVALNRDGVAYGRGRTGAKDYQGSTNAFPQTRGRGRGRGVRENFNNVDDDRWEHNDSSGILKEKDDVSESVNASGRRGSSSPSFDSLTDAFETLDKSSRSARNITNLILATMENHMNDSHRWQKLIEDYLIEYACQQGGIYVELAAQLFVRFIDLPPFQKAAYIVLMKNIGQLMTPHDRTRRESIYLSNLCEFFGKLLISSWPPGWDSCAKECNMIVYAIMNAVHTWLRALEKSTSKKAPSRVEITEVSALGLVSLTNATGRKLWLKWPDLVDQMYSTLKPVIVSNECGLCEETKSDLLDLFVKLNDWPKPVSQSYRKTTTRDVFCQTDEGDAFTFTQWPTSLPTNFHRGSTRVQHENEAFAQKTYLYSP